MEAIEIADKKLLKARFRKFGLACGSVIILFLWSAADAKPAGMAASATAGVADDEFDRTAAAKSLTAAAGRAATCKTPGGPTGTGRVAVTFEPSGKVRTATVEGPPFAGTRVGGCVASAFRVATVPPFSGSPVTVHKSFSIN